MLEHSSGSVVNSTGYQKSTGDGCIYTKTVKQTNGRINFMILGVYDHDIVPVSNDTSLMKADKAALREIGQDKIGYLLGMSIKRDWKSRILRMSQPAYLQKVLKRFGMEIFKPISNNLELDKRFQQPDSSEETFDVQTYQQVIGCPTYTSTATRPDITAAVEKLAQFKIYVCQSRALVTPMTP